MSTDISEKGLESLIMRHMTGTNGLALPTFVAKAAPSKNGSGWFAGNSAAYDREFAVDNEQLFSFLSITQPDEYAKLGIADYRDTKSMARQKFPERVVVVTEFPRTPSGKIRKDQLRLRLREPAV